MFITAFYGLMFFVTWGVLSFILALIMSEKDELKSFPKIMNNWGKTSTLLPFILVMLGMVGGVAFVACLLAGALTQWLISLIF